MKTPQLVRPLTHSSPYVPMSTTVEHGGGKGYEMGLSEFALSGYSAEDAKVILLVLESTTYGKPETQTRLSHSSRGNNKDRGRIVTMPQKGEGVVRWWSR